MTRTHVNLFPQDRLKLRRVRQAASFYALGLILLLVLLVMSYRLQQSRIYAAESLLKTYQRQIRPVRYMKKQTKLLRKDLQELTAGDDGRQPGRKPLQGILAVVLGSMQEIQDQVSLQKIALENMDSATKEVRIQGLTTNRLAFDKLLSRLRETGVFSQVTVRSRDKVEIDGIPVEQFLLVAELGGAP